MAGMAPNMMIAMPQSGMAVAMQPMQQQGAFTTPPVVMAQPMDAITPAAMVREDAAEGLADRLAKLAALKQQGVLTDAEFEQVKAAEIAKG